MKIDFVSDVTCPWCAIGLHALEQALQRVGPEVQVDLRVQPFELNPDMPADGEELAAYLARKYGASAGDLPRSQQMIRERGATVGFEFGPRTRVWNTFDAHRLLHWAGTEGSPGRQLALKHELLAAYHTRGENPGSHDVLLKAAAAVGLDVQRARAVLGTDEFVDEVRERMRHWQQSGINAVPSVIVDDRYLIQGGQPVEAFERALREIAVQSAEA